MTDFTPADTAGLTGDDLTRAVHSDVHQLHVCFDAQRKEMRDGFAEARKARKVLSKGQADTQDEVRSVAGQVEMLAKIFGAKAWAPGEEVIRPRLARDPWWKHPVSAFGGLCVLVGGASLGLATLHDPHTAAAALAALHAFVEHSK